MQIILAWTSLALAVAACATIALVGFKRSAWWGPMRSVFEPLDEKEIRIVKVAGVLFLLGVFSGIVAMLLNWKG